MKITSNRDLSRAINGDWEDCLSYAEVQDLLIELQWYRDKCNDHYQEYKEMVESE